MKWQVYRWVRVAVWAALVLGGRAVADEAEYDRSVIFKVGDKFTYDDNLFRVPSPHTPGFVLPGPGSSLEDSINTASAGIDGRWTLGRQVLGLQLNAADNQFIHNTSLDNVSSTDKILWDWRFGNKLSGEAGADYVRALADFANSEFYSKDLVGATGFFGNGLWDLGPHLRLKAGIRHDEVTHSAAAREGEDYSASSGNFGFEYATSSLNAWGLNYQYTNAAFGQEYTLNGLPFNPDYHDNALNLYFRYAPSAVTQVEAGAGYVGRKYPDAAIGSAGIGDFSGPVWHASVQWQPSIQSGIKISTWRDLRANLDAQSNYFVSTGATIAPVWSPIERLKVSIEISHENQNFIGSNITIGSLPQRHDAVTTEQIVAAYKPRRRVQIDLSYHVEQRKSDLAIAQYKDDVASMRVRWSF